MAQVHVVRAHEAATGELARAKRPRAIILEPVRELSMQASPRSAFPLTSLCFCSPRMCPDATAAELPPRPPQVLSVAKSVTHHCRFSVTGLCGGDKCGSSCLALAAISCCSAGALRRSATRRPQDV